MRRSAEKAAPGAVFALVAQKIGELFGARTAAVSRFDAADDLGTVVGGWSDDGQDLAGAMFALSGVTASAQVFRTYGCAARTDLPYQSATGPDR